MLDLALDSYMPNSLSLGKLASSPRPLAGDGLGERVEAYLVGFPLPNPLPRVGEGIRQRNFLGERFFAQFFSPRTT
jgi:hypothetical protein